jgi:hypothetical protein
MNQPEIWQTFILANYKFSHHNVHVPVVVSRLAISYFEASRSMWRQMWPSYLGIYGDICKL